MATVNTLESKNNKNEAKMHFTWSSALLAALGTFKLHLKGLGENFFMSLSLNVYSFVLIVLSYCSCNNLKLYAFVLLTTKEKAKVATLLATSWWLPPLCRAVVTLIMLR
jgi:hypothetical protein